jgi:CrcB protein
MRRFLLVCLGGALGTGARYYLAVALAQGAAPALPRATLLVNLSGSYLIALVVELSLLTGAISQDVRLFLTTGIMGGYTTYSSFNFELLRLAGPSAAPGTAAAYLALTLAGGLVAGFLGLVTARALSRALPPA